MIVDTAGPAVELGPWNFSPNDARLLAVSLNVLANLADGTREVDR